MSEEHVIAVTQEWLEVAGNELDEHMAGGWMAVHKLKRILGELGIKIVEKEDE